jgi:hypothetical protein
VCKGDDARGAVATAVSAPTKRLLLADRIVAFQRVGGVYGWACQDRRQGN